MVPLAAGFKEINWRPIKHRVAQMKLNLVYKIVNDSAPEYLQNGSITSVKLIGTQHAIVYLLCIFLPLRVQEKILLPTQQLSSGMKCLGKLRL